jgi:hypothetical protein
MSCSQTYRPDALFVVAMALSLRDRKNKIQSDRKEKVRFES